MYKPDFKYLLAWLIPIFGFAGFYFQSWFSPGSFYLGFVIIPLMELITPVNSNNDDEVLKTNKAKNKFFDVLLYLNLPALYFLLFYFIYILNTQSLNVAILIFLILNMGILLGVMGINVAHELGHRNHWFDKLISQLLLLPCLYMHFTQQHNHWHHKYVATPLDPSTARKNETIYTFWLRSIVGGFKNAIKIEKRILKESDLPFFHWKNKLLFQFTVQFFYLCMVWFFVGFIALVSVVMAAIIAILLLETINYIEHYGLMRKEISVGQFEKVNQQHSWNSDHSLGRIFLYELTRHPHHHEKASVKYQNLDSLPQSPQLPFGYPASLLITLLPGLWFRLMNKKLALGSG
jgi:alkane 1-monooxygenase